MSSPFTNTIQSMLSESKTGRYVGWGITLIVLSLWSVWFFLADIALYKSAIASLKSENEVYIVEALVSGRVMASHMGLNDKVASGEILVELEDTPIRLKAEELSARLVSAHNQLGAIKAEIQAVEMALSEMISVSKDSKKEGQLIYEQVLASKQLAEEELLRWRNLRVNGYVSEVKLIESNTRLQRLNNEAKKSRVESLQKGGNLRVATAEQRARIERLRREEAMQEGIISTTNKLLQQTKYDRELYKLTAPVEGPLADVADLRPGMVVKQGDRIASIMRAGGLIAVAEFLPAAIGHIKVGHTALLRLESFPWAQYGKIEAKVLRVATELRQGKIRVELSIPNHHASIPLQHGLVGRVEVEVERVSPAVLTLQTIGGIMRKSSIDPTI